MSAPVSAKRIPFHHRRWLRIAGFAIVTIVLVTILMAGILYALWQSRPERALLNAVHYAVNTPATYKITSGKTDVSVGVKDDTFTASGTLDGTPIESVYSENTLYIKSPQPQKIYSTYFAGAVPEMFTSSLTSILTNLKNRWISIDMYKLAANGRTGSVAMCGVEGIKHLRNSDMPNMQIGLQYVTSPFINAETLYSSPIQTKYAVSFDQARLKAFSTGISKLDEFKNQSCAAASNSLANNASSSVTADVTLTRPDHHLRELTIRSTSNKTTKVLADYTKVPTVTIPTDVVSYDQIAGTLLRSMLSTFIGSR